jgi:hypothetical protein
MKSMPTTLRFLSRTFWFAPLTGSIVLVYLFVLTGAAMGQQIFHLFWFYLNLPAYFLMLAGVNVGAVLGIWGPPLVTIALFAVPEALVTVLDRRRR